MNEVENHKSNKKTLIIIISIIVIFIIIGFIILITFVTKKPNENQTKTIETYKSELLKAGNSLINDICIVEENKEKCDTYYQELDNTLSSELSEDKNYKYICTEDIKKLNYYNEEIKYENTQCQGVVIYEIDKVTEKQINSFSYIECANDYPVEKTEQDKKIRNIFDKCFTNEENEQENEDNVQEDENKIYKLTIKYVEDELNGTEIKERETIELNKESYENDVIASFNVEKYIKENNIYSETINTSVNDIEFVDSDPKEDENGIKTYKIKKIPKKDIIIAVIYQRENFNITYNNMNGLGCEVDTIKYKGSYENLCTPSRIGYTFKGWSYSETGEIINKKDKFSKYKDITLYAQWTVNKYTIILDDNSPLTLNNKKITCIYEKDCILPTNTYTKTGYHFAYWNQNSNGTGTTYIEGENIMNYTPNNETIKIYAIWTPNEYSVIYESNGGSAPTVSSSIVQYNNKYGQLPKVSKPGYTFKGWFTSANGGNKITSETNVTIASDHTLYAQWEITKYTITFNENGATTSGTKTINVGYDEKLENITPPKRQYTLTLNPNGGTTSQTSLNSTYTFQGYYNNGIQFYDSNGNSTYVGEIKQNLTLTASWNDDNPIKLPQCTKDGYECTGWNTKQDGSGTNYNIGDNFSATKNITLYAQWRKKGSLPIFTYTGLYVVVKDDDTLITSGKDSKVIIPEEYENYTGNWKIRFLSTGEITFHELRGASEGIDVFLVGGGGNGGSTGTNASGLVGGGGGGGGQTKTILGLSINKNTKYSFDIAVPGSEGTTTAFNESAEGGTSGEKYENKNSSDGGGAGGNGGNKGGKGANNTGNNQTAGSGGSCSLETREFAEEGATCYAAGGGGGQGNSQSSTSGSGGTGGGGNGGTNSAGMNGENNTGSGAGGGGAANGKHSSGGMGGSGIVIIRNKR